MRNLRDWQDGDSVRSREHHQQAVDALRELDGQGQRDGGRSGSSRFARDEFTGKIVAHGKDGAGGDLADYTDARYWVERQYVKKGHTDDGLAAAAIDVDTSNEAGIEEGDNTPPRVFTVTNLPECAPGGAGAAGGPTGCHLLSVGDAVRVWAEYDGGDPNRKRYLMRVDPSPVRVRATTAIAAGRYNGKAQKDPTADVPTTGALAAGDMGTDGASVVLLYPPEVGGSSASLPLDKVYLGDLTRVNADGTAVLTLAGGGTGGKPTYFPVRVQSDGGGPFVPGGGATYTYALYPIGSTSGGVAKNADGTTDSDMGQSPAWARQPFWASAATHGTAYYAADGKLTLYQVDEVYGDELCDTATGG